MKYKNYLLEIPPYTGPIGPKKVMNGGSAHRGYTSFRAQWDRCNYPKNKSYRWYGGKGIKVEYSSRDFISWWVFNEESGTFIKPTVSRIDHDKNYCFSNIKMEEYRDNISEPSLKRGVHLSKIASTLVDGSIFKEDGSIFKEYASIKDASDDTGIGYRTILLSLRGTRKTLLNNILGITSFVYLKRRPKTTYNRKKPFWSKPVAVFEYDTNKKIFVFNSLKEASFFTGVSASDISMITNFKNKSSKTNKLKKRIYFRFI